MLSVDDILFQREHKRVKLDVREMDLDESLGEFLLPNTARLSCSLTLTDIELKMMSWPWRRSPSAMVLQTLPYH